MSQRFQRECIDRAVKVALWKRDICVQHLEINNGHVPTHYIVVGIRKNIFDQNRVII
jgi:hypothetical protein